MADGIGCKCCAYNESECGCDADWTPQEIYDLRARIAALEAPPSEGEIDKAAQAIYYLMDGFNWEGQTWRQSVYLKKAKAAIETYQKGRV